MKHLNKTILSLTAAVFGIAAGSGAAQAAVCSAGIVFGADFGGYSCTTLGTPGNTVPNLGGLTFLDSDTILIGSAANGASGTIQAIDVIRDAGNHITGFAGPSTFYAEAPYNDGGIVFGPNGVLFAARWPVNELAQYKPGSTSPDKITSLAPFPSSLSAINFVPAGFDGAGKMKAVSYSGGAWADITLTPDGLGTFDISVSAPLFNLGGGPEGFVYVDGANAGFNGLDSLLVSEYGAGKVGIYAIDANGNPILASRRDFLTGLGGAEGAVIDPLTGDFLFSTFGGGNQVVVISGFIAPPPPPPPAVPEPASWALLLVGFGAIGHSLRQAKRRVRVAFA